MSPELSAYARVLLLRCDNTQMARMLDQTSALSIGYWAAFTAFPAAPMLLTTLAPSEAAAFCEGVADYYKTNRLPSLLVDVVK